MRAWCRAKVPEMAWPLFFLELSKILLKTVAHAEGFSTTIPLTGRRWSKAVHPLAQLYRDSATILGLPFSGAGLSPLLSSGVNQILSGFYCSL